MTKVEHSGANDPPMSTVWTLLLTDVVSSTNLTHAIGDAEMSELSTLHDRLARDLLPIWRGREIDKADGMLLLFGPVTDAVGYALDYHRLLQDLPTALEVRAGIHVGPVVLRANEATDVALGAKPLEVEGMAKPVTARIMSVARGGQTLLSGEAHSALGQAGMRTHSHGHWRMKGLPDPIELFEVVGQGEAFRHPEDSEKAYRVVKREDIWVPSRGVRHNIPAEHGTFVGREDALAELATRLRTNRSVSVIGMGGTGKTRLATHFARSWLGEFPGGVAFCDLSQARNLDGILFAVAQALDVPLSGADPSAQLARAIAGRGACLVILDNFEQVLGFAQGTLGLWLDRTDIARFLITSRELLGLPGEQVLTLAPLSPQAAASLFVDRAKAAKSDFSPTREDTVAIDALIKLLDNLPLALELAAARVRVLAPNALLARMHERFRLLSSTGGRLGRQATLRATLDWSWELLSPTERSALAQLSVFAGGFTVEAAEAVLAFSLEGQEAPWPIDVLHSLVNKSFVRQATPDRFDLLESVREYASEHLCQEGRFPGSGTEARIAAERRHGMFFAFREPNRTAIRENFEVANLVVACQRAAARGDGAVAVGALNLAWIALRLKGPFRVGVDISSMICSMSELSTVQTAAANRIQGAALMACGRMSEARPRIELAVTMARASGDRDQLCRAQENLAVAHMHEGRVSEALEQYEMALESVAELNDPSFECSLLSGLGTCHEYLGHLDQAGKLYQAALQKAVNAGVKRWQSGALGNLGQWNANQGRIADARQQYEQALLIVRELGDRQGEGNVRCNLGLLHLGLGDGPKAQEELELALKAAREIGYMRLESVVLCNLGLAMQAQGAGDAARRNFELAVELARSLNDRRSEGQFRGYLGALLGSQDGFAEARRNMSRGAELLRSVGDKVSLGLLISQHSEVECLAGDRPQAVALLEEAERMAIAINPEPESEFARALRQAQARIADRLR